MKFSLVLATVGRVEELERFLSSLELQNYSDVEVLLVDQNPDDRLHQVVAAAASRFKMIHLRSERGLSRARNTALTRVTGDIVAFPDDDCWYPPELLDRVSHVFSHHPDHDGLTGRPVLPSGLPFPGWDCQAGLLTKANIWTRGISFTIFLRRRVIDSVGAFDESLGAGTTGGAGEETDYLLSALERGFRIYYEPSLFAFHPKPGRADSSSMNSAIEKNDAEARRKAYSFTMGVGRVLRKHNYSPFLAASIMMRPLEGAAYSLLTGRLGRALVRWKLFTGAVAGYRGKPPANTSTFISQDVEKPLPGDDREAR